MMKQNELLEVAKAMRDYIDALLPMSLQHYR